MLSNDYATLGLTCTRMTEYHKRINKTPSRVSAPRGPGTPAKEAVTPWQVLHSLIASNDSANHGSSCAISPISKPHIPDTQIPFASMSHDRRQLSREEEEYYYNHQRSHSQGGNNGYYDDTQGNPYAYYSQPQASPEYSRNSSYRGQEVARNRNKERYYSEDEDSVSGFCP